jgi:hypothetical protein
MAIEEQFDERSAVPQEITVRTMHTERRPVFSAIRWGAVLAGVAVGLSVQLALSLLGIAAGLSAMPAGADEAAEIMPLVWAGVSMLASAFVGGYVAARMSGFKRKADGILHGAVSWAVTTILFAVLATTIGGVLLSSVFNNMSQLAQAQATASGESPLAVLMRSQGVDAEPAELRQLQHYLQAGERHQAIRHMSENMGIEAVRAEAIVDQALILSGSPEAASPRGREATEKTTENAGTAAWVVFLTVALALVLGTVGGALGAAGSRRVNWSGGPNAAQ